MLAPLTIPEGTVLHPHQAYRRGLCTCCQQVAPAAGLARCYPCHSGWSGQKLTPELMYRTMIRRMTGSRPDPRQFTLAVFVSSVIAALTGTKR